MPDQNNNSESLIASLKSLHLEAVEKISNASSVDAVEKIRVEYLGKKGAVSNVLANLRNLDPQSRRDVGQIANQIKAQLERELSTSLQKYEKEELDKKLLQDELDSSAPGVSYAQGAIHPIRKALREAVEIFELAGLAPVYGPEVEYENYCFDRLNFKPGHPARDMQATFFVKNKEKKENLVLRTHTSPVQVRALLDVAKRDFELPLRIQVPGRVYRVDDDATHAPMFHQIEGLAVDKHSTMGDLRAVLDFFCRKFFDDDSLKVRFRPSYFPFTEPSAEVDVSCVFCHGSGCRVCKQSGWLEVAGAGMVHPNVFTSCGWDPEKVQGWAFGVGIERLAMLKLGVPDLRLFFENRLSFLRGNPEASSL